MKPDFESQLEITESWREAGKEIPKAVEEGLYQATIVGAAAGDENAILHLMTRSFAENPNYVEIVKQAQEAGAEIPEEIAAYIGQNSESVQDEVNALGDAAQRELDERFNNLIVNGHVNVKLSSGMMISPIENQRMQRTSAGKKPANNAKGGLISSPTLSWFAEESPEMAIPLDGSNRSMDLWVETWRLLVAYEANNYTKTYEAMIQRTSSASGTVPSAGAAPIYQPMMNFYGNTTREDVEAANEVGFEQFREWYERLQYEQARVAF